MSWPAAPHAAARRALLGVLLAGGAFLLGLLLGQPAAAAEPTGDATPPSVREAVPLVGGVVDQVVEPAAEGSGSRSGGGGGSVTGRATEPVGERGAEPVGDVTGAVDQGAGSVRTGVPSPEPSSPSASGAESSPSDPLVSSPSSPSLSSGRAGVPSGTSGASGTSGVPSGLDLPVSAELPKQVPSPSGPGATEAVPDPSSLPVLPGLPVVSDLPGLSDLVGGSTLIEWPALPISPVTPVLPAASDADSGFPVAPAPPGAPALPAELLPAPAGDLIGRDGFAPVQDGSAVSRKSVTTPDGGHSVDGRMAAGRESARIVVAGTYGPWFADGAADFAGERDGRPARGADDVPGPLQQAPAGNADGALADASVSDRGTPRHGDQAAVVLSSRVLPLPAPGAVAYGEAGDVRDRYLNIPVPPPSPVRG